jgi:hypothetical protein
LAILHTVTTFVLTDVKSFTLIETTSGEVLF